MFHGAVMSLLIDSSILQCFPKCVEKGSCSTGGALWLVFPPSRFLLPAPFLLPSPSGHLNFDGYEHRPSFLLHPPSLCLLRPIARSEPSTPRRLLWTCITLSPPVSINLHTLNNAYSIQRYFIDGVFWIRVYIPKDKLQNMLYIYIHISVDLSVYLSLSLSLSNPKP